MTLIPAILSALLLQASGPQPKVTHERLGENSFRLHITIPSAQQLDAAHRMMAETMRSLCGGLHPVLGSWEPAPPPAAAAPLPAIDVYQELTCAAELLAPPSAPRPASTPPGAPRRR